MDSIALTCTVDFGGLHRLGFHRPLGDADFFAMRDDDNSQAITDRFEKAWDEINAERAAKAKEGADVAALVAEAAAEGYISLAETVEGGGGEGGRRGAGDIEEEGEEGEEGEEEDKGILSAVVGALYRSGVLRPFFVAAFFKLIYDSLIFVGPSGHIDVALHKFRTINTRCNWHSDKYERFTRGATKRALLLKH